MLPPFEARQVHGTHADGKIFMEPLGRPECLYSRVGEPRMLQAACLSACLMSWPLLPIVAPIVAPVPLRVSHHHRPQQGVPTCLSTRGEHSRKTVRTLRNIILHMWARFTLWEQLIRPSLKAMGTLVIRRLQGYGNTASLSYPDTRMRKPDCLHLPYRHQPGASAVPSTSYLITQRDGF